MTMDKGRNAQDSHSKSKAPGDGDGTSPEGTTETFTKAQLEEAVKKAEQKARIDAGRDAKSLEQREKAVKEAEERYSAYQRQQEESENEKYRSDPDGLKAIQEKRQRKQERDELTRQKAEVEADKAANAEKLAKADELELELAVWKAAQAKGVDADKLKTKVTKFGLKTEEQILDLAETMAVAKKEDLRADSNKGIGGSGELTVEKADKMSMEEYAAARKKEDPSLSH
ncbi:MAG: hypothetical protein A2158_05685 [Chloroflexi bacterium RBG_13_46_14]|nr:MAG: hypothetical protein A2158_05685 [Chloroflexi bacterium RBG_13_46_14]